MPQTERTIADLERELQSLQESLLGEMPELRAGELGVSRRLRAGNRKLRVASQSPMPDIDYMALDAAAPEQKSSA